MGQNRAAGGVSEPRKGFETVEQAQTAPYAPTQPALRDIIGEFGRFYNEGVGTELPDFSPIADLGPGTQNVISAALGNATGGPNPQYQELYDRSQGPNPAQDYFQGVMGGNTRDNPYFQQLLDRGSERISNQVNSLQSARGRFGGIGAGGHVEALGQAISDYQTPLQYQNLQDAYSREGNAASSFGNQFKAALSQGAGITGMQDRSQLANLGFGLQAGGIQDRNAQQRQLADYERALWEMGGADQASLSNYLNSIGSIAGLGGETQIQQPYTPFRNFLGDAMQVAGTVAKALPW